jgi:hypothetical protein
MPESERLLCSVCGEEIRPDEPAVQQDDGVIVHARCVIADASNPPHTTRQNTV